TISISGSSLARSTTVFPMRPAAPTSNTRTGDFFIKAEPSLYPLPFEGRGDLRVHLESRSRHTLRSGSVRLSPRGERIEVRGFICFAQIPRAFCAIAPGSLRSSRTTADELRPKSRRAIRAPSSQEPDLAR